MDFRNHIHSRSIEAVLVQEFELQRIGYTPPVVIITPIKGRPSFLLFLKEVASVGTTLKCGPANSAGCEIETLLPEKTGENHSHVAFGEPQCQLDFLPEVFRKIFFTPSRKITKDDMTEGPKSQFHDVQLHPEASYPDLLCALA